MAGEPFGRRGFELTLQAISHLQKESNLVYVELAAVDLSAGPDSQARFERRLAEDYLTQLGVGALFDEAGVYLAFRSFDKNKIDDLNE